MRDWGLMLGGLIVWALHFALVYGLASVADISDPTMQPWSSVGGWTATGLSLAALAWITLRTKATTPLVQLLGIGGSILAGVAVILQSLPLAIAA